MPFGQPVTSLIDHATDTTFGTGEKAPWITMHSTGNKPRDHAIYAAIERQFRLSPAMPTADLEPHYTGWVHGNNVVDGEQAESGSDRDNYFSRAQMYGCVLSGGLAGHVHGTGAYDVTSAAEPPGARPYFWQALRYESAEYMRGLGAFVLSEGVRYRDLQLASDDLVPRKAPGSSETGLDGWSFLMRTPDRAFGLLYFENKAAARPDDRLAAEQPLPLHLVRPSRGRVAGVDRADVGRRRHHAAAALPGRAGRGGHGLGGEDPDAIAFTRHEDDVGESATFARNTGDVE